jgi:hypothetical protein
MRLDRRRRPLQRDLPHDVVERDAHDLDEFRTVAPHDCPPDEFLLQVEPRWVNKMHGACEIFQSRGVGYFIFFARDFDVEAAAYI